MIKNISIEELSLGMYIIGIKTSNGNLGVKKKGILKSESTIQSLKSAGVEFVEVDIAKSNRAEQQILEKLTHCDSTEHNTSTNIDEHYSIKKIERAEKLYAKTFDVKAQFIKELTTGNKPDFSALSNASQDICIDIHNNENALSCLVMLQESSNYLIERCVKTSMLLCLFAKQMGFDQEKIENVTMSGLLMDCGMSLLPKEIVGPGAKLNASDDVLLRTHIDIGYEIAERFSDLPEMLLDIISNHHERADGSGYPKQKLKQDISLVAQMAGLVDAYLDCLYGTNKQQKMRPQQALDMLLSNQCHAHELINEFIIALGVYPVGSLVCLQSNRIAMVLFKNKTDPLLPKVMVFYDVKNQSYCSPEEIDLATQQDDPIIDSVNPEVFDLDLSRFLKSAFTLPN
ncbi:HD-GYP domain-containing protein [Glaciecola petra]|uniref:DUF3391 domain-containing protein n=1 Tax=Glaciecola petra TaxID=3075602 RepID=A0ABU2ZWW4_9ALTE|nr:HD domain-containing phosphohydrolase [Aestuariibacter sp. P117]MDT0595912.1 DUF3391 domain-containing protein [Aestuariibacter sp. P117]